MTSDDELAGLQQDFALRDQLEALADRYEAFLCERGLSFSSDEGQRSRTTRWRLRVFEIAALRMMLDVLGHRSPAEEATSSLTKMRLDLIASLWHEGLWVEPWISLVNQEFSGPDLAEEDLDQIIVAGPEIAQRSLDNKQQFEAILSEMVFFLVERGYEVQEADMLILVSTMALETFARRTDPVPGAPYKSLGELLDLIQRASQPDHPAWPAFLEHFFQVS
jgi:hypothetical protein